MPGHKYNPEFLPPDLLSLDMTEIDGMDNLHAPEGAIKRLQEKIASVYGADESFFLVNGSSSGIVAAICAVCGEGMPLYVQRNCHQSVFNAMVLSGANPLYFNDIIPEVNGAAVVITCPSYGGDVIDILPIADKVHAGGGILIVDEAHGAHFPFHGQFPPTALSQGADIAVNSFHKTLPALTQTAALHVRGTRANRKRLRFYLRAMQTTSPSYIFMASVDFMLDKLERGICLKDILRI